MCLLALALRASPRYPFVLAANRDEFLARPSQPLAWWPGGRRLGGRDLQAGGSWLLLTPQGRLAVLTNVREPARPAPPGAPSRGRLVDAVLDGDERLLGDPAMAGFNLLQADLRSGQAHWHSNRPQPQQRTLEPGRISGLSNAALDTPWPKLLRLKAALAAALQAAASGPQALLESQLWQALADRQPAPDAELPDTGVGPLRERQLSSAFIRIDGPDGRPVYGTRCSTLVLMDADGKVTVIERRFEAESQPVGESRVVFSPG